MTNTKKAKKIKRPPRKIYEYGINRVKLWDHIEDWKKYAAQLEQERDYSKAMLKDQIKKKRGISKIYGELFNQLAALKEKVEYLPTSLPEHQSSLGWVIKKADLKAWCNKTLLK